MTETPCVPRKEKLAKCMAQFHEAGYCVVPQAVTSTEVDALREECTLLCADHALKKRSLLESGCVMDLFRDVQIPDESRCRVDTDEYLQLRAKALKQVTDATRTTARQREVDCNKLVLGKLASLASHVWKTADAASLPGVFLFNEHYIFKPPQSQYEFRWHKDSTEQLAMCFDQSYESVPYVSAWVALCDMSETNGTLVALPLADSAEFEESESEEQSAKFARKHGVPLCVRAGDVVLFRSDLWHCSGSNNSDEDRMAYYAQFSPTPIVGFVANPVGLPTSDSAKQDEESAPAPPPLLFAIPCTVCSGTASLDDTSSAATSPRKRKLSDTAGGNASIENPSPKHKIIAKEFDP